MHLEVRTLKQADIDEHLTGLLELLHQMPNEQYWDRDHLIADLPDKWKLSFIASVNGTLAGMIVASTKPNKTAHIHKFVVGRGFRRMGLGRRLVVSVANSARAAGLLSLSLNVYANNEPAIKFHQSNGFLIQSSRQLEDGLNYYLTVDLEDLTISTKNEVNS